jgi:hypothetical protein
MCPSFVRLAVPLDEGLKRFEAWHGPSMGPPRAVPDGRLVAEATAGGLWRGDALVVHRTPGERWTLIEDLSGCLSTITAERWLALAHRDELLFAAYNDAIGYGELVHVKDGAVLRSFLHDRASATLESVGTAPELGSWIDVATIVDEDAVFASTQPGEARLWLFAGVDSVSRTGQPGRVRRSAPRAGSPAAARGQFPPRGGPGRLRVPRGHGRRARRGSPGAAPSPRLSPRRRP